MKKLLREVKINQNTEKLVAAEGFILFSSSRLLWTNTTRVLLRSNLILQQVW